MQTVMTASLRLVVPSLTHTVRSSSQHCMLMLSARPHAILPCSLIDHAAIIFVIAEAGWNMVQHSALLPSTSNFTCCIEQPKYALLVWHKLKEPCHAKLSRFVTLV